MFNWKSKLELNECNSQETALHFTLNNNQIEINLSQRAQ